MNAAIRDGNSDFERSKNRTWHLTWRADDGGEFIYNSFIREPKQIRALKQFVRGKSD